MSEMIEFRWIDSKERLPGMGQMVFGLFQHRGTRQHYWELVRLAECKSGDRQVLLWETCLGKFLDGLVAWWPIPEVPSE